MSLGLPVTSFVQVRFVPSREVLLAGVLPRGWRCCRAPQPLGCRPFSLLPVFALPFSAEQFILLFTTGITWSGRKSRRPVPGVKFKRTAHSSCRQINKVLLDTVVTLGLKLFVQPQNSLVRAVYASLFIPPFPRLPNHSKYVT